MLESLVQCSDIGGAHSSCAYILTQCIYNCDDDHLFMIAMAWRRMAYAHANSAHLAEEILFRTKTSRNSYVLNAYNELAAMVRDKVIILTHRQYDFVVALCDPKKSCHHASLEIMSMCLIPPASLFPCGRHAHESRTPMTRLRQLAGLSRLLIRPTDAKAIAAPAVCELEDVLVRTVFNVSDERHHCLLLSLKLCPNARARRVFTKILEDVDREGILSLAVCETGVALGPPCEGFLPYLTKCALHAMVQQDTTAMSIVSKLQWPCLDLAMLNTFFALKPREYVSNLFWYCLESPCVSPPFLEMILHSGKMSVEVAKALASKAPQLMPSLLAACPPLADWAQPDCGICFESMNGNSSGLSCHMSYHVFCLASWWAPGPEYTGCCPVCRRIPPKHSHPPSPPRIPFAGHEFYV